MSKLLQTRAELRRLQAYMEEREMAYAAARAKVAELERKLGDASESILSSIRRREAAEAKAARLLAAFERAPHARPCAIQYDGYECNCWKAEALKEVQRDPS